MRTNRGNRLPAAIPALLAIGSLAWAQDEAAPDTAPVAIHTPALETPVETAGTGLSPEVNLAVTLDEKGKVSAVEILSIEPSSRFDGLFEQTVRETLARWRYAPALRDGRPVQTELRWTVKFPSRAEGDEIEESFVWRRYARAERETQDFRRQILTLPLEQRIKLLAQNADVAGRHLNQEKLKRVDTPRFIVYSDAPSENTAQVLANNLEASFNILAEMIGEMVPPQPEPYRIVVFMYATEVQFDALKRDLRGIEWAAGFYNPSGLVAFHMQMVSNESLVAIMLHEAAHAYLDRYVARPGVVLPRWLDEGLADYLGNSTIKKKKLIPGKTRRTEVFRGAWGIVSARSVARSSVDDVKSALRKGEDLTLAELIGADIEEFYGDRRELYYTSAWLLIHFLRHGRPEWEERTFSSLLLYVAEGYRPLDAFRALYGDPVELQTEFRDYVKSF